MTATFFLVRHAAHDDVGRYLAGRLEGVRLGAAGRAQAARLAQRLKREDAARVFCSPRERALETAEAVVGACDLPPAEVSEALDEIDFGRWAGSTFDELEPDADWRYWNTHRSLAVTPAGETMLDVQRRIVGLMTSLIAQAGRATILVSHADVIKAAVSHVLGLPIDAWPRFDIAPASVTTVTIDERGARLGTLNETIPD